MHRRHGLDEVVDGGFAGCVERDCCAGLLRCGAGDHDYAAWAVEAGESVQGELGAADWVVEVDFQDFVGGRGGGGVCAGFEGPEGSGGLGRGSI